MEVGIEAVVNAVGVLTALARMLRDKEDKHSVRVTVMDICVRQ